MTMAPSATGPSRRAPIERITAIAASLPTATSARTVVTPRWASRVASALMSALPRP
jgi:hypothetical protein